MVAQDFFSNAFVSDGIVPDEEGMRTVVEHRSRLYSVPPNTRPAAFQNGEMDLIVGEDGQPRESENRAGFLFIPDLSESENVHRHLNKYIDASALSNFDHRFFSGLRLVAPMNNQHAFVEQPRQPHPIFEKIRSALGPVLADQPKRRTEFDLISWHWAGDLVAFATGPNLDRICGYNFGTGACEASGERINELKGSRCIAFRPFGGRHLAIGCNLGIAFLRGELMEFLKDGNHTHIVSLDWSSDGLQLATASAADGKVKIWDIGSGKSVVLCSGSFVRYNPRRGQKYLFVASANSANFKLWNCETWKSERWGSLSGPVVAATWSPDGSTLLFSTEGESAIHVLSVGHESGDESRVIHGEVTSLPREGPGGTPIILEMDQQGERLAVVYDLPEKEKASLAGSSLRRRGVVDVKDPNRRFPVAIYATQFAPHFSMHPVGYVCGPPGSGPAIGLKFKPQTNKNGSILSCMWQNGEVTFVQFLYDASFQ